MCLALSAHGLLKVGNDILGILYAHREAYEIGGNTSLTQLLVRHLAVGMAGRMKHTRACVGHMCDDGYELEIVHEAYGILTGALQAITPHVPSGIYFCARA